MKLEEYAWADAKCYIHHYMQLDLLHPNWWENAQVFDDVVNASQIHTIMRYVNGDVKMQGIVLDEYHAYKTKEKGIIKIPPSNDPYQNEIWC